VCGIISEIDRALRMVESISTGSKREMEGNEISGME
jgi:hypothetical protein